jgi:ubiquitin carboxyl-terminal hydrolase 4/11/15
MGGLGGGHYIACCKNKDNGQWNVFNDHNVTPVKDPNNIKTNYAYVLFYKKQGSKAPSEQRNSEIDKNNNSKQPNAIPSAVGKHDSKIKDKHKKKHSKKDNPKKAKENGTQQ